MVRKSRLAGRHNKEAVAKFLRAYVRAHALSSTPKGGAFRRVDPIHRHFRKIDHMFVLRHTASS
jgi:hypothetical protein